MDAEYPFVTHDESLDIQEAYVKAFDSRRLDNAAYALETLERDTSMLQKYIDTPFKRVSYDDADRFVASPENVMTQTMIT